VASLLVHLARDMYAAFLLPDADDPAAFDFGLFKDASVLRHPLHDDFCRAVLVDDALKFLFPEAPDLSTPTDHAAIIRVRSTLYFSQGHARVFSSSRWPEQC
jgi:hypothetical protein